jgi:hypothetical protein
MPVNTAKVKDRRTLSFRHFNDIRRDLTTLENAHRAKRNRATGNWSPGQILAHLAGFINYPYDGYPKELGNPPAIIRFILKFMKKTYIWKRLPVGVAIPGVPGGTVGADNVMFEIGMERLRTALDRMERTPPTTPNKMFGMLTHEEWMALQCRHAELHLSFLHPS